MNGFDIVKSKEAEELYNSWKVIGKSLPRAEGHAKATGKAVYPDDVRLPGMLCAKLLRSPYAHAKIKRIDTSKAEREIGFEVKTNFKEGLKRTIEWYKKAYCANRQRDQKFT